MENAALPMQCPSDTLLWVYVQPLCKRSSFCVFFRNLFISPRRAKLGGLARGMRSVDTPPPTPAAGAPPAGLWQGPNWVYYAVTCV
jgi:hypothetical protein